MKPEDAKALWPKCGDALWFERNRSIMLVFARACEQHGVERAKALAEVYVEPDWSALDAEIAKENE